VLALALFRLLLDVWGTVVRHFNCVLVGCVRLCGLGARRRAAWRA
jgi:hypothetical protein